MVRNRLQMIGTLSGGQKSRVAFSVLSLQQPHVLLLDEVNYLLLLGDLFLMPIHLLAHQSFGYRGSVTSGMLLKADTSLCRDWMRSCSHFRSGTVVS